MLELLRGGRVLWGVFWMCWGVLDVLGCVGVCLDVLRVEMCWGVLGILNVLGCVLDVLWCVRVSIGVFWMC